MDARPTEPEPFGPAGFDAFYDHNLPIVYGYLLRLCGGDVDTAKDLCQDTWLGLVRHVREDPGATPDTGWLVTAARSRYIDRWRRTERLERKLALVWAADRSGEHGDAEIGDLLGKLDGLSATHRLVLTLRYLDGLGVPEVATAIGRSLTATYSLLARARDELRSAAEGRHR